MKKVLSDLLKKCFDSILDEWQNRLQKESKEEVSENQLRLFVKNTLEVLINVVDKGDFHAADQYLIEIYHFFSELNLSLLEISQFFAAGRHSLTNAVINNKPKNVDSFIIHEFVDEIIEQVFVRYSMLHQEIKMKELISDRNELAAKLELNQKYLSNILQTSDSAIFLVDANEKIIAWNKGAENIFGYKEEEVLGKSATLLVPKEPKYHNELNKIIDIVKKKGFVTISETERVTKYGTSLPVDLSVSLLPDKLGRSIIIKDRSKMKELQEQIDQSEKLAVIGQMAAGIAHEIGNPLASISSLVQLMQRKIDDDYSRQNLAVIRENIDRITKIVRELVDFSRPPKHNSTVTNITEIVKTAIGIVRYDKRVKKVEFVTNFDNRIPMIDSVPDQILQVFVNILLNALDAIDGEGRVEVSTCHDEEKIYIEISDDGCGMDKNTISKIFNPFFTTKEVGKGTGLGLSVSYGIIKKFNGDIKIKSEVNKGSKFMIVLPIKNGED
jgi:PAS domain S-box-containing protein